MTSGSLKAVISSGSYTSFKQKQLRCVNFISELRDQCYNKYRVQKKDYMQTVGNA